MKTYIGTKIIQAEPAFRIDGEIYPESGPVPRSMNREEGYRVHYPDGYESWSPKADRQSRPADGRSQHQSADGG